MNAPFSVSNRKIDPGRRRATQFGDTKPDGTPNDNDRVETGPTGVAFAEWAALGLEVPNLEKMREVRLGRICGQLQQRDLAGVLCFDPLNIRYATDSINMSLWTAHNPSRACFVSADGYIVLWDFHGCAHLSGHLPLIKECRTRDDVAFFYFAAGDKENEVAGRFAAQIDELVRKAGGDNRRIAVDKIEIPGLRALDKLGLEVHSGMEVLEHARLIKGDEEIKAMRCAMATCEVACAAMYEAMQPGMAETELWAVLQAENIARGGEWIETRILSSGPRTNPWMQEAGPRIIQNNELVCFDTDLIGPYGMCADMSRSWFCGDGVPTPEQRRLHAVALEHIQTNMALLKPGVSFTELTYSGHMLPEEFVPQRYGVKMHGVGLCDEFPAIMYPEDFTEGAFDYELQPGMMLCVEAYIGTVGGKEGVKLEEQVLITEDGFENMTTMPFCPKLTA